MTYGPMPDLSNDPRYLEMLRGREYAERALLAPSWCHMFPDLATDACGAFDGTDRVARRVRGRKMPTWDRLYDEFAAAWQFGEYFGENLNAFDDCMRAVFFDWPEAAGFVVVIANAEQLFAEEATDFAQSVRHLTDLVESLQLIVDSWAEPAPGPDNDPTARPALKFDVVLTTPLEHREDVVAAWRAAGAPLEPTN